MFGRSKTVAPAPEAGTEAPEFNLPSAQGGQLRLSMRTVRGPVIVVFLRGPWSEEDVAYFKALAGKETEINHAGASIVGIGALEPDEAREFVRLSGIRSYVLYDYQRITTRQWGLSEEDREHGEYARPAVFLVGGNHEVIGAWVGERPSPEELLAKVSEITGLPKPPEEAEEEKPKKAREPADAAEGAEKPGKKMTAEERERVKAERRAAREAGRSVKTGQPADGAAGPAEGEKPKKMTAEERERVKAERRAARAAGKSLKKPANAQAAGEPSDAEAKPETRAEEQTPGKLAPGDAGKRPAPESSAPPAADERRLEASGEASDERESKRDGE